MIKHGFAFFLLFISISLFAQEEMVQSIYFDTNKSDVDLKQTTQMVDFIKKIDSTRIESIQIFGYCDDVGKDDYNRKLSTERANKLKNKLVKQTESSQNFKLTLWGVLIVFIMILWVSQSKNQPIPIIVTGVLIVIGFIFIRSHNYDDWLHKMK
jgi:t-SNARE complex subunit (syntaxin)